MEHDVGEYLEIIVMENKLWAFMPQGWQDHILWLSRERERILSRHRRDGTLDDFFDAASAARRVQMALEERS